MPNAILDGLSLVDSVGAGILAINVLALLAGVGAHLFLRAQYRDLERDLDRNGEPRPHFTHGVLNRIVREAEDDARRSRDRNAQAIIEDAFQSDLRTLLVAERFVRAATGLVLVLGLLGTFYGLTLSIGKLVHLVSADSGAAGDVAQALTNGLTQALSGMAAAFSNSLVGVASAVVLTLLGVVNNVTDRRMALMVRVETYVDRWCAAPVAPQVDVGNAVAGFGDSVRKLERTVARFESALQSFAERTNDLREVHLVLALKPHDRS
jgi:hypothetical protein